MSKQVQFLFCFLCTLHCISLQINAQSFKLLGSDTINKIDIKNLKQGPWKIYGNMSSEKGYAASSIVEEGNYLNSRKTGTWIKYFKNGNEKSIINYRNGRAHGHYKVFFENGRLEEEGNWSRNRNTGKFTRYYANGKKHQEFIFSNTGKRNGIQKYYHENGKLMIVGNIINGKEQGEFIEYNPDGSIKEKKYYDEPGVVNHQKTITKTPSKKASEVKIEIADASKIAKATREEKQNLADKKKNPFNGNGNHTLYNKNKQLSKKGFFKNYRLIDGFRYVYTEDGILEKIEKYKGGKYVGDAPIEPEK